MLHSRCEKIQLLGRTGKLPRFKGVLRRLRAGTEQLEGREREWFQQGFQPLNKFEKQIRDRHADDVRPPDAGKPSPPFDTFPIWRAGTSSVFR
jgi:hypothetical protein